ncbi:MAG: leucine-rich repeat domain-containing protein [Clostridia bacterium]|nr:leucine-rich repeat domain-containing protein [Clostridia bacterium]
MGHITQQTHNVARFSDFDRVTSEDVEAAESLMPELYGVLFHNCYQILSSAFYANNRVEILYMNKSGIIDIGSFAFNKCKNLKTAYLPNDLRYIYNLTFEGCENLKEIVLPEGLLSIGDEVFRGCSSLEEIIIPESVCTMGADVFRDCNNLHSIKLSKKLVETYGEAYIKSNNDNIKLIIYDEDSDEESNKDSTNSAESAIDEVSSLILNEGSSEEQSSSIIESKSQFKSFNGVIRKNLIAEKKKANGMGGE